MSKPSFVCTRKRHRGDCAVAALASLLQRPYEEVLVASALLVPVVLVRGLNNDEIIKIALKFGCTLIERTHDEIDYRKMTGLLGAHLQHNSLGEEHAVVLSHGLIYDPEDGEVWRAKEYLKQFKAVDIDLLSLED